MLVFMIEYNAPALEMAVLLLNKQSLTITLSQRPTYSPAPLFALLLMKLDLESVMFPKTCYIAPPSYFAVLLYEKIPFKVESVNSIVKAAPNVAFESEMLRLSASKLVRLR